MCEFKDVKVATEFMIPFEFDHEMGRFIKLRFNKAKCLETGKVEHFVDNATVWLFE